MSELSARLEVFAEGARYKGKGPLSVVLVVTRRLKMADPPFVADDLLTPNRGQVSGLSRSAVQEVLKDYGIERVLAEEGGRTSRGSIGRLREYVGFLNELWRDGLLDLEEIEAWWVERVKEFFASLPLRVKLDSARSVRSILSGVVEAAFERQRSSPGTMVVGAVIQHLVGAKLSIALPAVRIDHRGFSVADASGEHSGDFVVGDTVVHVTTAPGEALMHKCVSNLAKGLRPLVITTAAGAMGAAALARDSGVGERVEVLELEQFLTTNILEWSEFGLAARPESLTQLLDAYNRIVEACETDLSLRIEVG
jgi:hypothetical protein